MKHPAPIPTTVALPPGPPGNAASPGISTYKTIASVDPGILPDEAADIARRAARFAALRPGPLHARDEAIAQWREQLHQAVATDDAPLPSIDGMIHALAAEAANKELAGLFRSEWDATIAPLGKVIASHGDDITRQLQPIHDDAWARFQEHALAVVGHRSMESVLAAGDDTAEHYRQAGHALSRFSATRAARMKLQELRGYAADVGGQHDMTVFANPTAIRGVRLDKRDTLSRWRSILDHWPSGEPRLATKAEAEADWATQQKAGAA